MTVWQTERVVATPEKMHGIGVSIGEQLRAGDVLVLTGELGAGKTTLTRGIGEGMGVRGPVTSPTFVLARTHPSLHAGPALIHVDAYRLGGADELDDLDLDWEAAAVVVEWGREVVAPGDDWVDVTLSRALGTHTAHDWDGEDEAEPRMLTIEAHGERWREGLRL